MSVKSDISAQLAAEIKARRKLQEAQLNASIALSRENMLAVDCQPSETDKATAEAIAKEQVAREALRQGRELYAQANREAAYVVHPANFKFTGNYKESE